MEDFSLVVTGLKLERDCLLTTEILNDQGIILDMPGVAQSKDALSAGVA